MADANSGICKVLLTNMGAGGWARNIGGGTTRPADFNQSPGCSGGQTRTLSELKNIAGSLGSRQITARKSSLMYLYPCPGRAAMLKGTLIEWLVLPARRLSQSVLTQMKNLMFRSTDLITSRV